MVALTLSAFSYSTLSFAQRVSSRALAASHSTRCMSALSLQGGTDKEEEDEQQQHAHAHAQERQHQQQAAEAVQDRGVRLLPIE